LTYNEVFQEFSKLAPVDQHRFIDAARQQVKFDNSFGLMAGSKVQFKTQHGVHIAGTVTRVMRKNVEVLSKFNRDGLKPGVSVRWKVNPELLIPIPSDKVGMYEFP
jgi:hypothetical protein